MSKQTELATFAGGCFWCIESAYNAINGVNSALSGYMDGHLENPSYQDICTGQSGHAEVVHVSFDPNVISYENYNDYTKVILDYKKQSEDISALITTENFAAGIAIKDKDQTFGLLNGNKKCSYAVFIGDLKVPGIVNYSNERQEYVFLNYIPIWQEINIGDEVITSGMDNVFYEGVKVGKIVEIEKYPTMQKAYVKPYANILKEKYYFVYTNKQAQITPISAKP